jgi:hypothetical protein
MKKNCRICKKSFFGRKDKQFCTIACKNEYHTKLRAVTQKATIIIDNILHRNRSILLEIMGKDANQKKIERTVLDKKKFNYKYHTHTHTNVKGKTYFYLYDFGWMEFSDQQILIVRKRRA